MAEYRGRVRYSAAVDNSTTGKSTSRRSFYRRVVLLLIVAGLLLPLGKVGWRAFLDHAGGGIFAPEDAPWVLSADARGLIGAAFAGLDGRPVVDYRVMAISDGQLGEKAIDNDSFYRRDDSGQAGPLAWLVGQLRLSAAGVAQPEALDAVYMSRVLRQIRAMPATYRVHLLARGWRYDDAGRRDVSGTFTHVANRYVWWLSQQAPDVIEPVVSIHPYRAHALDLLAKWARRGVNAVAWQPLRQNIDLNDPRTKAFYRTLAAHGMGLYLPVGRIDTVYDRKRNRISPMALRPALKAGVAVTINLRPGDDAAVVDQVLRLLRGPYAQQLRVDLSGVLASGALSEVLSPLLQHPRLYSHLVYASGYPRSAVNRRIDLETLAERGFIDADVGALREIYRVNPLLFVFVVLRTLHLPHTQLQLPIGVFAAASRQGTRLPLCLDEIGRRCLSPWPGPK